MILCTGLFLASVAAVLALGRSLLWALLVGLALFSLLGLRRGFSPRTLAAMAWRRGREALIVLPVLLLIGTVTALWRACGTISFFLYTGLRSIPPHWFLLMAFLLTAALSAMLGTSFGVTGTAGVVLLALARSGGVPVPLAAGAVLSGAYFGDRCSPMSSCAALVAACTGTELYTNVWHMLRTAVLPTALSAAFYGVLSLRAPLNGVSDGVLRALREGFTLSWPVVVPAVLMLALPLLRVPVKAAMAASAGAALALAVGMQHLPAAEALRAALLGYVPAGGSLSRILAGGGVVSMLPSCGVVLVTSLYTGILEGIGALTPLRSGAERLAKRLGLFPAAALVSAAGAMLLCNQSAMILLDAQLLAPSYACRGRSRTELALDIANSGVTIAGLVPWSIAQSIPLAMLGAGVGAVPYAVLLYLIPLCYLFTKPHFAPAQNPGVSVSPH